LVVDRVVGSDGEVVLRQDPEVTRQIDLSPDSFEAIRQGMLAVVDDRTGTARNQRLKHLAFGGKTGTAQVVRLGSVRSKKHRSSKRFKDHAWFTAFAPYTNPEVAITVLVEHGEHGSTTAAPIARKMFEHYFQDRLQEAEQGKYRIGDSRKGRRAPPSQVIPPGTEAHSAVMTEGL
jgi:penicillin-binding protein 2